MIGGRKSVAPPIGAEPCFGPAWPNRARSWATEKSQAMPISWPPPMRMPLTRRIAGVVLSVFLGVSAGAERLVAGPGKHHGDDIARGAGRAEREDHALHHIG